MEITTETESADKSVTMTIRTTPEAKDFVHAKATRLGVSKNDVMKKMLTYAALNMRDEDYTK